MMTIAADWAVQMLQAGWRVKYHAPLDCIEWTSPDGMVGGIGSGSLDDPPSWAVEHAKEKGHIINRYRVPLRGRQLSGPK